MSTLWTIILTILIFGLLIFIHEFGHFITAKMLGVRVYEFALGMGPRIFGWEKDDTKYNLRIFPIGGFVQLEGEDEESESETSFTNMKIWKRFTILAAGSIMNLLLGFLIVVITVISADALASTTVHSFHEGSLSDKSGLMAGDEIVKIDKYLILIDTDIPFALMSDNDGVVDMVVKRNINGINQKVELKNVKFPTIRNEASDMTVSSLDFYLLRADKNIPTVLSYSFGRTVSIIRVVYRSFMQLITGKLGINSISGPVGTSSAVGDAAKAGFGGVLFLIMMLSINLGVLNLLPIPALDGGKLFFLVIEKILGRPFSRKYENIIHFGGFVILMGFIIVISFNDILKLFR